MMIDQNYNRRRARELCPVDHGAHGPLSFGESCKTCRDIEEELRAKERAVWFQVAAFFERLGIHEIAEVFKATARGA